MSQRLSPAAMILMAAMAVLPLLPSNACATPPTPPLSRAYRFLYLQMDKYQRGSTLRLVQSYAPTPTFSNGDISYTYDDDVMLIALLARGSSEDISRARVLGDTLLYAQEHDAAGDGRVRDAYHASAFIGTSGRPNIANGAGHTGNLAWTGLALAQLYRRTGDLKYLKATLALAEFIQRNFSDARGIGGYTGGYEANGAKLRYKSVEHNLDIYALFTMLAHLTGDRAWKAHAGSAFRMVGSMWEPKRGFFWIGTALDGQNINKLDPVPEDVQTWSFLSLQLPNYQGSMDWALANLSVTHGPFHGLSFAANDRTGVWFEGTAHAAAALAARNIGRDSRVAATLLANVEAGQASAPNADGNGIDAASKDGLKTGDGANDRYNATPHIATTAWYCLAKQSINPFQLWK